MSAHATTLELALLGLVALRRQSGYDIKRIFETTALAQFSSSPGAIYPALARLEARGLLASKLETAAGARRRRVYAITPAGEDMLDAWLHEVVTVEELSNDPTLPMLRFSMAEDRLNRGEVLEYLQTFREATKEYLQQLEHQAEELGQLPVLHPRLALEHGLMALRSQLGWIDEAERRLRSSDRRAATGGRQTGGRQPRRKNMSREGE